MVRNRVQAEVVRGVGQWQDSASIPKARVLELVCRTWEL